MKNKGKNKGKNNDLNKDKNNDLNILDPLYLSPENIKTKYIAAFLLHALGDTIGFKNSEWEFNYFQQDITLNMTTELLYDFIDLGGINGIDLNGWYVSDDTIINMAMTRGLLQNSSKNKYIFSEETLDNIKQEFIIAFNQMFDDRKNDKNRYYGETTLKYIKIISKKEIDGRNLPYDEYAGGNGAAMRSGPLGMAFYGNDNRNLLIESSISQSKITHNNAFGYLGGLTVSLFSAFAVENQELKKWPYSLISILESKDVEKHITKNIEDQKDYLLYINYWKKYIDTRFENNEPILSRSHKNLIFRSRYYYENFARDTLSKFIGESGFCATIMAYDSLLDSSGKWEKLVIYSGLHLGDSDTVCAIAGFLFGLVYGMADVPKNNLKYLEYYDELIELGNEMFDRYQK